MLDNEKIFKVDVFEKIGRLIFFMVLYVKKINILK